jgi:hypothetical protein
MENQSCSKAPNAVDPNPISPQPTWDRLEKMMGVIQQDADPIQSSQAIDLKKGQVCNVVAFTLPSLFPRAVKLSKATQTVTAEFFQPANNQWTRANCMSSSFKPAASSTPTRPLT